MVSSGSHVLKQIYLFPECAFLLLARGFGLLEIDITMNSSLYFIKKVSETDLGLTTNSNVSHGSTPLIEANE